MFFECRFLDLPKIPKELVADIKPGELIRNYPGREYVKNGVTRTSAPSPFYRVSPELEQWIKDNICSNYNEVGVRYSYGCTETPSTVIHTDETRSYVLMYNLDNGGGKLDFWQQWGFGLVRQGRHLIDDHEKVLRINQFETPNHCWYMIDARILHSVERMTSTRINIQVSLDYNPFDFN